MDIRQETGKKRIIVSQNGRRESIKIIGGKRKCFIICDVLGLFATKKLLRGEIFFIYLGRVIDSCIDHTYSIVNGWATLDVYCFESDAFYMSYGK